MPRLVENIRRGIPVRLQGSSGITINPTHVYDAVRAIKASLSLSGSHKINIAGPELLTMKEIADTIGGIVLKQPQFIFEGTKARDLIGSTSDMSKKLVKPVTRFKDGIGDLI